MNLIPWRKNKVENMTILEKIKYYAILYDKKLKDNYNEQERYVKYHEETPDFVRAQQNHTESSETKATQASREAFMEQRKEIKKEFANKVLPLIQKLVDEGYD